MKSKFWMTSGVLFIYGKALDANLHKHNATQLIWPASSMICNVSNQNINTPVIIAAGLEHQLEMQQGWVVLVEPQSNLGEQLASLLAQKDIKTIDGLDSYNINFLMKLKIH